MSGVTRILNERLGRRASHRLSAVLPALVKVGEINVTARLLNVGRGGAKLETSAPVLVGAKVTMCCGTIVAKATVIWRSGGVIGVNFETQLSEGQVQEQVSRCDALAARRNSASPLTLARRRVDSR